MVVNQKNCLLPKNKSIFLEKDYCSLSKNKIFTDQKNIFKNLSKEFNPSLYSNTLMQSEKNKK